MILGSLYAVLFALFCMESVFIRKGCLSQTTDVYFSFICNRAAVMWTLRVYSLTAHHQPPIYSPLNPRMAWTVGTSDKVYQIWLRVDPAHFLGQTHGPQIPQLTRPTIFKELECAGFRSIAPLNALASLELVHASVANSIFFVFLFFSCMKLGSYRFAQQGLESELWGVHSSGLVKSRKRYLLHCIYPPSPSSFCHQHRHHRCNQPPSPPVTPLIISMYVILLSICQFEGQYSNRYVPLVVHLSYHAYPYHIPSVLSCPIISADLT